MIASGETTRNRGFRPSPSRFTGLRGLSISRLLLALVLAIGFAHPAIAADRVGLLARESHYTLLLDAAGQAEHRFQPSFPATALIPMYPIAGDWNGDGTDTVGLFDLWMSRFWLRDENTAGPADSVFAFGSRLHTPIAGDWNGDGVDTIGTYDPSLGRFSLRNTNGSGSADLVYDFGPAGSYPIAGDWDGDGVDTVGVYIPGTGSFELRNAHGPGPADHAFVFGPLSSIPFAGDHDGDGDDSIGVYTPGDATVRIRHTPTAGGPDLVWTLDATDWAWVPIAGNWAGAPVPETLGYEFPTATPAQQGFDPAALAAAFDEAGELDFLRSLLVLRNGRLVGERYYGGATRDLAGNVKSVSKSVLSALVGIALGEGHFKSDDQSVLGSLPDLAASMPDAAKRSISIWHCVTMTSGLAWNEADLAPFFYSPDWPRFVLDQPVVAPAGSAFLYSTGLTHLMSHALTEATGTSTSEYARTRLFEPLGIAAHRWDRDPAGVDMGGAEVYMVPRDMARFGELYRTRGTASLRQIVPRSWIDRTTAEVVPPGWIDGDLAYGGWWWRKTIGGQTDLYYAWGYGGQFVFVFPQLALTVVTTSRWNVTGAESSTHSYLVFDFLEDFLLPAIQ